MHGARYHLEATLGLPELTAELGDLSRHLVIPKACQPFFDLLVPVLLVGAAQQTRGADELTILLAVVLEGLAVQRAVCVPEEHTDNERR